MKNFRKSEIITFSVIYSIVLVIALILLILKRFGEAVFVAFPLLVLFPIYLSFRIQYYNRKLSAGLLIASNIIRFVLIVVGILIPTLIWYFVPAIKESTSKFMVFVPAVEVLGVYTFVMVHFMKLGKTDGGK